MIDPAIGRGRWIAKKATRRGVALLAWLSGSLALRARRGGPRVRVLTYHRFGHCARDPFCITPRSFERQMRWLAERGLAVSLERLERFLAGRDRLPGDAIVVTIDDGASSAYREALPILREFAIPAVAFVTAGVIGDPRACETEPERFMTWDEIGALADAGITIGSHAWTHRSLARMSREEAREEGRRSRETLERRLGREVRAFAYPFGTRSDYSDATGRVLASVGYSTVFTSRHGSIASGAAPLRLPRIKVEGGEGMRMFEWSCRGAMDAWRAVDDALWRLQRPRRPPGDAPE